MLKNDRKTMGMGRNGNYHHSSNSSVEVLLPLFMVFQQMDHKTMNCELNSEHCTVWIHNCRGWLPSPLWLESHLLSGHTKSGASLFGVILPIWYDDNVDCRTGKF